MKSIVIFYSYGGNTRSVAQLLCKAIGADLAEIQTVQPYTGSYDDVVDQGRQEVDSGYLPELLPLNIDLAQYDTVVLGTPVWWYTFAPAMNAFLHGADLAGKTVYPFATNGGWIGHTFRDFEKACSGAHVQAGLNIRFNGNRQRTTDKDILKWAQQIINTPSHSAQKSKPIFPLPGA